MNGIALADVSILGLVFLTWGTASRRAWAWWGALIYFCPMTASWLLTLARSSLSDILSLMVFAPTEMEALSGVPLHGIHLAPMIGIPLLLTLGLIVASKRHFGAR
jgi:hypothetical protein